MKISVVCFAFLVLLFLTVSARADDLNDFSDFVISGTIKVFAKTYVHAVDLEKLKARKIKSISAMKEARFQRRISKLYNTLNGMPEALKARYGLKAHMTKQEVIREIRRIDKKSLLHLIDDMPDEVIIRFLKAYFHQSNQAMNFSPSGTGLFMVG